MSYTKGPWLATKDINVQGNPTWRIDSPTVGLLASLIFMTENDRDTFGQANAQLIAAAPDMLEALELIEVEYREMMGVSLAENYSHKRDKRHKEQYRKVFEAIAKAKGGQA